MKPHRAGLLIGSTFGLVYVVVNAARLPAAVGRPLQILGVLAYVGLLVLVLRPGAAGASGRRGGFGKGYAMVVAAEVVALVAGNLLLSGPLDLPRAVLPWVSIVVGAHFAALAQVWKEPSLSWLGGGITLLGAIGLMLAVADASDAAIAGAAGVGPGILLLGGSWWAALRG